TKRVSFVLLPEGDDPDSLVRSGGAAAFEAQVQRALPLSRFLIDELARGRSLTSAEDRAAILADGKPLLLSMAPGALRLQLLRELSDAARTPLEDVEVLYGLRRTRFGRGSTGAPRPRYMEVDDLKRRILQHLLAHPALAREFGTAVATEHVGGDDRVDQEIRAVWEAAAGQPSAAGAAMTQGALL